MKIKFRSFTALFILLALILSFASACSFNGVKTKSKTYWAFGTYATLVVSADFNVKENQDKLNNLDGAINQTLQNVENSLSLNVTSSFVNAFNNAQAGESVKVDKITADVFGVAKSMYETTNGYFNPAVYYSLKAYGFYDGALAQTLPVQEELSAYKTIAEAFNKTEIIQDENDGDYYLIKPIDTVIYGGQTLNLKVDLGGIGKGYAVDLINAVILQHGFTYGYFSIGSSSIAINQSYTAQNNEWNISLTHPRASQQKQAYAKIKVKDKCLSTSGDYEKYFEKDGVRYCHIIDATTCAPTQTGIITATVIGGTATEGDALSTALLCMPLQSAMDFINENLSTYKVCLVLSDGQNLKMITNDLQSFEKVASDINLYQEKNVKRNAKSSKKGAGV